MDNQQNTTEKEETQERGGRRNYPVVNLDEALKVAAIVSEMKGNATKDDIEKGTGKKGGGLLKKIAAARQWGLIDGQGKMHITALAMDILHPEKDEDAIQAKVKAYFNVPIFKTIYETYGWNLPRKELLVNVLIRQGISKEDAVTVANLIYLYKTIFNEQEQNFEIEVPQDDKNVVDSPQKVFTPKEFQQAVKGGERLTENTFNLILNLGSLRESIKNFDKPTVESLLNTLDNLIPDYPLIKSQIDLLKSDVSLLDAETLKKIMPARIDVLIKMMMHNLGAVL